MELKGIYPVVPTPFDRKGALDLDSIQRLAVFMGEKGVDGITVLGALGEGHKLTVHERVEAIAAFKAALPGSLGLVVGVRAAATDPAIGLALQAEQLGADALLVGPPPVQNDHALVGYFERVAEAVKVPIIVHDFPANTGIIMTPELLADVWSAAEGIRYIKLEEPPTPQKMRKVWSITGSDLKIFGAYGGLYAFEELESGAVGVMTGFAYPELLVELYRRHSTGDVDGAARLFYDFLPLNRFEFQPGIGVHLRKEILVRRGIFSTAKVRHPGPTADAETLIQLWRIVEHLRQKGYEFTP